MTPTVSHMLQWPVDGRRHRERVRHVKAVWSSDTLYTHVGEVAYKLAVSHRVCEPFTAHAVLQAVLDTPRNKQNKTEHKFLISERHY